MLILHSAQSNRRDNAPNGIGKSGEFLGGIGGAAAGKQVAGGTEALKIVAIGTADQGRGFRQTAGVMIFPDNGRAVLMRNTGSFNC